MKKYIAIVLSVFTLTACDDMVTKTQTSVAPMTQPIVQETPIAQATTETATTNTTTPQQNTAPISNSASSSPTNGITEETITSYYENVAEEKAIEADIEKLETDFRMGRIQNDAFQLQKSTLKQQENMLEAQIDPLEDIIPTYTPPQNWVDTTNIQEMTQKLQEIKIASDQFEFSLDQAEYNYITGNITREAYKQQVLENQKQKDVLDKQEDILENILESYGWDD